MGKGEKGQPPPTDQSETTYVIAAFDAHHYMSVLYTHCKRLPTLTSNLEKAIEKGATIISIRVITPPPLDQHQQEALFT